MRIDTTGDQGRGSLIRSAFGKALTAQRVAAGHSQRAFARLVGISNSHLRKIESGQTSPTVVTLYRMADVLQVSPGDLLAQASELVANG